LLISGLEFTQGFLHPCEDVLTMVPEAVGVNELLLGAPLSMPT
jgi:hypothetical protein